MEGRAGECEGLCVCVCKSGGGRGVAIDTGENHGGFAVDGGVIFVVVVCVLVCV